LRKGEKNRGAKERGPKRRKLPVPLTESPRTDDKELIQKGGPQNSPSVAKQGRKNQGESGKHETDMSKTFSTFSGKGGRGSNPQN